MIADRVSTPAVRSAIATPTDRFAAGSLICSRDIPMVCSERVPVYMYRIQRPSRNRKILRELISRYRKAAVRLTGERDQAIRTNEQRDRASNHTNRLNRSRVSATPCSANSARKKKKSKEGGNLPLYRRV